MLRQARVIRSDPKIAAPVYGSANLLTRHQKLVDPLTRTGSDVNRWITGALAKPGRNSASQLDKANCRTSFHPKLPRFSVRKCRDHEIDGVIQGRYETR